MTSAGQADRCPGVLRLHDAADGQLARVRLPGGRIGARGLRAVAGVAERGNGIVELTSRASLQIRGLAARSGADCASILGAAGLLPSASHERVRNILASPVAGRHPDARAGIDDVVEALDRAVCADPALTALSGRFVFAVDDGTGLHGGPLADVTLRATATGADMFELLIRGIPAGRAAGRPDAAALAVEAARTALSQNTPEEPLGAPGTPPGRTGLRLLGRLGQRDGRIALTVLPRLGRLDPPLLRALAALVEEVRIAPQRTITVPDLAPRRVAPIERELHALGLVEDPSTGWHGLSACAGLGACRRARHDVRAEAARRAGERDATAPREHWAACERRCGRPAGPHLMYTATADGITKEVVA